MSEWAPITVIRGLHGYGKTTLVAMWLESQDEHIERSIWVSARPAFEPSDTIERCIGQSLRTAGYVSDDEPPAAPLSGLGALDTALLSGNIDGKFVLVVDNFQHVADAKVLAGLVGLVERHRNLHLYVCCPGRHAIEALTVGSTDVNVIAAKDLLFSLDEIVQYSRSEGVGLNPEEAARLRSDVGPWIPVVRSALLQGHRRGAHPVNAEEYLRTKVLSGVEDPLVMDQLQRLSLTASFNQCLYRDLCGGPNPALSIDALEETGLVERADGPDGLLYVIPGPLRRILREQLTVSDPSGAGSFHRELARWLADHRGRGHCARALYHAAAGASWELMDRIWEESIFPMIAEDQALVSLTLDTLPTALIGSRPSMQVFRVALKGSGADRDGQDGSSRVFAEACEQLIGSHWDTMPLSELPVIASGYLIRLRQRGLLDDARVFADRVAGRIAALSRAEPGVSGKLAWFHLQRGITYSLSDDTPNAVLSYRLAREYGAGSDVDLAIAHASANLALTYSLSGDTDEAMEWMERLRGVDLDQQSGASVAAVGGHLAAGFLALGRLDGPGLSTALDRLGDGSAPLELWPFVAFLHAQGALYGKRALEGLVQLNRVRSRHEALAPNDGLLPAMMARAKADLLIACGRGESARRVLDEQLHGSSLGCVPALRLRVLGGGAGGVEIDPLVWDPVVSNQDRLELLLLGAVAGLRSGDSEAAVGLAAHAAHLYGVTRILQPFATVDAGELKEILSLVEFDLPVVDAARLRASPPVYPRRIVLVELSAREQSVLSALAETASRQAIADAQFVSVNTVKTQLASIYAKFGSTSRKETLVRAHEHGLLPSETE